MKVSLRVRMCILIGAVGWIPFALTASAASQAPQGPVLTERDGGHDFDFNFGVWKTHIRRLLHPLSGSADYIELNGTVTVRKVWDGRAQLEEIEADGPQGHWESLTLFLYNPAAHQWSVNFANSKVGTLSQPAIGEFRNGRGEFYDQESYKGRTILVRIVWSDITPDSHHFEQSFSQDGGRTWEPNFVATLTRETEATAAETGAQPVTDTQPGRPDFDWQFGAWKIHMSRLQHPLSGSKTWTELDGTVTVRKIWDGRANLAEIGADGPSGHLEFLSLRLYNPEARQWSLNFASSNRGTLSVPMAGEFRNGRGEFYDQEPIQGRMIWVRFVFANVTPDSNRDEQAFSDDGGKTWETNWINTSTRIADHQ